MRKTRRNRTPKELRRNDYPIVREYKGKSYDNDVCKNKIMEQDKYLTWHNLGCTNLRANGSARCESCAEDFKTGVVRTKREIVYNDKDNFIKIDNTKLAIPQDDE